jgi:adenylate kinase family enzyme
VVDRIAVHGASGSGKPTLATTLSERLDLPRTELDSLYHQAGWTPRPVDGNHRRVRDLVRARAARVVVLWDRRAVRRFVAELCADG